MRAMPPPTASGSPTWSEPGRHARGVRVEAAEAPLMRNIRYLDKLVDELDRGKALDKILRRQAASP